MNIMKTKSIIHILSVLLAIPLTGMLARAESITIDVLETFDYPAGTGTLTEPQKINSHNKIAGIFIDPSGVRAGFTRDADGTFSEPIVEPNDTGNDTEGRGINDSGTVCGDFIGSDGLFHGFFLSDGVFTEYDVPGAAGGTQVLGIADSGDFSGATVPSNSGIFQAFLNLGGNVIGVNIRDAANFSGAYGINGVGQFVGYYTDAAGINHGFFSGNSGKLRFPVDPQGSTGTILFGLNDRGWLVGRFSDSSGVTHGVLLVSGNKAFVFDFPGSTFTSLNGINQRNFVCGRYVDAAGIEHGILVRARQTATDEAGLPVLPPRSTVRPAAPSPVLPVKVPAS
jgi:hypothetical protein